MKNNLLLSLWSGGQEALECGQPVGRAGDGLEVLFDLSARSTGCPHVSARAGPWTRPPIHRRALISIQTHWLRAHTADCDGGSCWYTWIGSHRTSLRRGAGLSLLAGIGVRDARLGFSRTPPI